jgi:hypothetical protein
MTDTLTEDMLREYQERFIIPPGSTEEFHLFRVVATRGPAQPFPAHIPVGVKATLEDAASLADQLTDNCTIVIQRREWITQDTETREWRKANPGEQLNVKDDRDA